MCGITGFYGFEDKKLLERMKKAIRHRGPDAHGSYTDKNVSLGHRRLSIIDLSKAGTQPMCNEDETVWITYNGEIYNFLELRKELDEKGHRFNSKTDTEIIIHAYEEWGFDCLKRFNGMFAFAVWDTKKKILFLARDRLGIKPLYYYRDKEKFLFASEIKAILEADFVRRDVDMQAFYHYLTYINTPAPSTLFKGIKKLPAGHFMILENNSLKIKKWWDILYVKINNQTNETDAIKKTAELLADSVNKRTMSDVPHGAFLSGGLDSSAITALLSEAVDEPVNTFSVATGEGGKFNELKYAKIIADKFNTNHRELYLDLDNLMNFLPSLIFHEDEPISDPNNIPVQYLSEQARKNNVIVLQVGEGADELFCGYPYYGLEVRTLPFRKLSKLPFGKLISKVGFKTARLKIKSGYLDVVEDSLEMPGVSTRGVLGFTEKEKNKVISGEVKNKTEKENSYDLFARIGRQVSGKNTPDLFLQKVRVIELKNRLSELILMRVDKFTMAASIEARVPFLDYRLVEHAFSLPPYSMHMKKGVYKYILKKAVKDKLPREIIERKKVGFGVPIVEHFKGDLKDYALDVLAEPEMKRFLNPAKVRDIIESHMNKKGDTSFRSWTLLNFALWHKYWIRKEKIVI